MLAEFGIRKSPVSDTPGSLVKRISYLVESWRSGDRVDFEIQTLCYEAMFEVFWDRPWFNGLYLWKWFPDDRVSQRRTRGFTSQGKPAEGVLRRRYASEE